MTLRIPVLLGTTRIDRRSEGIARLLADRLGQRPDVETLVIDLATYAIPLLEMRLAEMEHPPGGLLTFGETLRDVDGLLMVVPEYKNGYPGVLKDALDHLERNIFYRKPIGICTVSSGPYGGLNCLAQLRLVCLAMGGLPIPARLPVSHVGDVFDPEGRLRDPALEAQVDAFVTELHWFTAALARQQVLAETPV